MNENCQTADVVLCECCEGVGPETPQPITNRPALPAVAYRVGTWATFRASMIAALSDPDNAALGGLRTRDESDVTIALLDAFAIVADILTFYQERIANESWLRTAVDQRSVFEIARLAGYQPSPGVSASAFLSFTMSTSPSAPDNVTIPAGTRVQSVPGPGQTPQIFETSQDFIARISYNAIPARTTVAWSVSAGDTQTSLQGTSLNLNPGDGILFSAAGGAADFHLVTSAVADPVSGTTTVIWDQGLTSSLGQMNSDVRVYVFRKKAALFGVQAPDPNLFTKTPSPVNKATPPDWDYRSQYVPLSMRVNLDAVYSGLTPAAGGEPQWVVFVTPARTVLYQIASVAETGPVLYTLTSKTTQLTLENGQVLASQPLKFFLLLTQDEILAGIVAETRSATAYVQSELLPAADTPFSGPWSGSGKWLLRTNLLTPVEGINLQIAGGQTLNSGQPIAVSGKRLRLQVVAASAAGFVPQGSSATLAVSDGQTFLVEAFPPAAISGNDSWQVSTLSGVTGTLSTSAANIVLVPADKGDAPVSESAVISQVTVAGSTTSLDFDQALNRIFDRSTVTVNANTVDATHGETVHEILGSGDATNAALQFTLKQSPLTWVSSTSASGVQSTLQVWVNNLQWHETGNFLSVLPADRAFVTRTNQTGNTVVQFGDGEEGSRPPTGQMNIRAMYRKGLGAAGMVSAGQLSQALDRPQGLKSVTNPDPATGGADPDSDAARLSAPLHVLTLDRVVSLEDYGNFARAFAGIDKALATWTWFGKARGVFLTVAGANGALFNAVDPTIVNLAQALQSAGNRFVPAKVVSFTPVLFEIAGNVRIDSVDYDPKEVLGRVWQALAAAFAFENRDLGKGIAQSEVVALIQNTAGVVAVELTAFNRSGQAATAPLPPVLRAAAPITGGSGTPQAAELLLIDPASRGNIGAWS